MARRDYKGEPVKEIETVDIVTQFDTHERTVRLEKLRGKAMLWMIFETGVKDFPNF
jgi:hypothetical protein